jgi:hypothetical protein
MSIWRKVLHSNFIIKLRHWEYWPFGIVQFPLFIYFAWLALKSRSLVFFSASNPGITMGGMFGESKYDVLIKIPQHYTPNSIRLSFNSTKEEVLNELIKSNLHLPIIFKPDLGERGFMVKRISNENDIDAYLKKIKIDFIAQELVGLPLEFGVFYTRFPKQENGKVTSVVMKEMLSVTGDGENNLQTLILEKDRAKLQWKILQEVYRENLYTVIPKGKNVELVSIGNHCLGTKFLDCTYLINDKLSKTFDGLSKQIDGFYFGRFDLRCASIEDLYKGNVKIMELNGCGAEPAHIYHPGFSLFKALGVLFKHWKNIFIIANQNRERGINYITAKEALHHYRKFKAATS